MFHRSVAGAWRSHRVPQVSWHQRCRPVKVMFPSLLIVGCSGNPRVWLVFLWPRGSLQLFLQLDQDNLVGYFSLPICLGFLTNESLCFMQSWLRKRSKHASMSYWPLLVIVDCGSPSFTNDVFPAELLDLLDRDGGQWFSFYPLSEVIYCYN